MCLGLAIAVISIGALAGGSMGVTFSNGRTVMAHSDSWHLSGRGTADTETVETAGYTIVVAPTQLWVDRIPCATIDATAKSIEVTVQNKQISFIADGRLVATYPR